METKFKVGDKVKIPTTKSILSGIQYFSFGIEDLKEDYLVISKIDGKKINIERPDGKYLSASMFLESDLEPYMGDKKIGGYILRDDAKQFEKAALAICNLSDVKNLQPFIAPNTNITVSFVAGYPPEEKLRDAGVLDLWFDPVYLPVEPTEETIEVGNPIKTIKVTSNEKIIFQSEELPIDDVNKLLRKFSSQNGQIGAYITRPYSHWIGCRSGGTAVTREDVQKVIDTYYKLNKR